MRVVYIERKPDLYGSGLSLLSMLDYLVEHGIEPLVIVIREGQLTEELKNRGIEYKTVLYFFSLWPNINNLRDLILYLPRVVIYNFVNIFAFFSLKKITKIFDADIIHTNVGPAHIGISVAKSLNIPHIWHLREYQDLDFGWNIAPSKKMFENKLNSKINNNLCITKGISDHFGVSNNSVVISDGIFSAKDSFLDFEKERYFLFLGRIAEFKGVKDVILAYKEFRKTNTDVKLLIAGKVDNKNYENELINICQEEYDSGDIRFLGYRNDIRDLLSKALALVVASNMEGLGRVTLEAMFSGCLVIGKNAAGTQEILRDKDLGILYNTNQDLVKALKYVANTEIHLFKDKLIKALHEAELKYSVEASGLRILDYYNSIINK